MDTARFEFATASRILFGPGTCAEVPALAANLGRRILLVADSLSRSALLQEALTTAGTVVEVFEIDREPNVEIVLLARRKISESDSQAVIGFGGGTGKTPLPKTQRGNLAAQTRGRASRLSTSASNACA